jgi:hypothetical protein
MMLKKFEEITLLRIALLFVTTLLIFNRLQQIGVQPAAFATRMDVVNAWHTPNEAALPSQTKIIDDLTQNLIEKEEAISALKKQVYDLLADRDSTKL